jgi:hypothetical protein
VIADTEGKGGCIQTTGRYLGSEQEIVVAVKDRLGF